MSSFEFDGFWFHDHLNGLLSDLSLHTITRDSWFVGEVPPLQNLAKRAYISYLGSFFSDYEEGYEFEEKVEEIYNQEKDYIYFMGNFFRRYIQQAETVVDSDDSSDDDSSDESIIIDFYPSSDDD